jgi:VanZ family protein
VSVIPVRDGALDAPYVDKCLHLGEYLLLAWLLVRALRVSQVLQPSYVLWAWIYTTSYGLLIEVIQAMLPWRSAELGDAAANTLGAALGVWIAQRTSSRIGSS